MRRSISKRINNFLNSFSNLNLAILVIVGLLCLFGMLSIYSASLNMEGSFFEKIIGRQLIWLVLSGLVAATIYFLQKKLIYDSAYILYLLGFCLLLLPYFLGSSVAGTARWITFGPAGFQPSEFAKIACVLAGADWRLLVS